MLSSLMAAEVAEADAALLGEAKEAAGRPLALTSAVRSSCLPSRGGCLLLLLLLSWMLVLSTYCAQVQLDGIWPASDDLSSAEKPACSPSSALAEFNASRVLILTVDDRPIPEDLTSLPLDSVQWPHYVLSHFVNARYAQYHHYVYRRVLPSPELTRASSWSKLFYLLHDLDVDNYDLVVAMDSDAWFTNLSLSLPDVLSCVAPDFSQPSSTAELLFSHDFALSPDREGELNAGVFITRTSPRARFLWQLWWEAAETSVFSLFQSQWPFEQEVLNKALKANATVSPLLVAVPCGFLYGHSSAYINHVTSYWPRQNGWKGRRERLLVHDLVMAAALTV